MLLINDGMWRVYGCKNRILSVDLVIEAWATKKAVQALHKAGFDDKPQSTDHFKSQKDGWWLPAHVFHLRPGPGEERHVDLNLFYHECYFPLLKSPKLGRPPLNDDTYLVTTDPRLAEHCPDLNSYEIKVLRPARLVEARVRLCYRDLYLITQRRMWSKEWLKGATWVHDLTNIFYSAAAADHTDGPSGEADHNLPWGFQNCFRNPFLTETPALTLRDLDPVWLRLAEFQPLFQEYWKAMILSRSVPKKPSPSRPVIDHCPVLSIYSDCAAYPAMNEFAWRFKEADLFPDGTGPFPEVHVEAWNKLRRDFPGVSMESIFDSDDNRCNVLEKWISVSYDSLYRWRSDPWSRHYRSP
ncbi:uncharacterized protein BO66DRAFT_403761 [Aspergillus aculeatinus CBS 121060]|uniref:Uncharacterized protein n=1 Tax=Aspergillus aculeatinus CBS 121060 TaxID=1448322 RepID=A0ACD1H291_9EURO|nr:hypothetical protein BO66DRAFT_403761 [Aspergillus aculeatinus CBS 121060]RAH67569.1 hypothetical protein BO66DRAFT_403761 [Aspergillus aculeatinus CBS 121060]